MFIKKFTSTFLLLILLMLSAFVALAMKLRSQTMRQPALRNGRIRTLSPLASSTDAPETFAENEGVQNNGDILLQALNADQDVSVKIVSCRELIQEHMIKQDLSQQAGTALGELSVCTLLMGAGLKDEESLQINMVSADQRGFRNLMVITDGQEMYFEGGHYIVMFSFFSSYVSN